MKSFNFVYFILTSIFVLSLMWLAPKYREYREARQQQYDLQQTSDRYEVEVRELKQRVNDLENDPRIIERVARENLGYSRPGEHVIIFREQQPADRKNSRDARID